MFPEMEHLKSPKMHTEKRDKNNSDINSFQFCITPTTEVKRILFAGVASRIQLEGSIYSFIALGSNVGISLTIFE